MAKRPPNQGKDWTAQELRRLEQLADGNTPSRLIALKLGRSAQAVRTKASVEGILLKPPNRSPYGRRN